MKNPIFLGTTAIKDFWDIDHPKLLLAGEWCSSYGDKSSNTLKKIPFLWEDSSDVVKAQKYCQTVYDDVLQSLSQILNDYLKINKDSQYYRIILGNWLIHFIHQAYDKFNLFNKANEFGEIETWTLSEEDYVFPLDFLEFSSLSENDYYQLQLFSQLAKIMKIENIEINNSRIDRKIDKSTYNKNYKVIIKNKLKYFKDYLYKNFSDPKVIIVGSYFKKNTLLFEFLIWMKSKRKIIFDSFNYYSIKRNYKIDYNFRTRFLVDTKKFEDLILGFAINNIPISYLENHLHITSNIQNLYPKKKLSFFTYNDLYNNKEFQFYIALNNKKHIIMSAQHGCGYGMDLRHEGEQYERSIVKTFFTYGWTDSSQTVPLPMPKILKQINKNKNKVLFLTTSRPRYINRFSLCPNSTQMIKDHIEYPIMFLNNIKIINKVLIRHHSMHDIRKWNNRERINAIIPNIMEDTNKSFYKSLSMSKMFVSDHIGTTFLEAMQVNKPSVVFINKNTYLFRKDFQAIVDKLVKNKILFYNPKEASMHVNLVYSDIDKWWQSSELQNLRNDFVNHYALTSNNWMDEWCEKLINNPST